MTNTLPLWTEEGDRLAETYRRAAGEGYDEMLDEQGVVRPPWRRLIGALGELTAAERAGRAANLDRRVRETGIAYDIFSHPSSPTQRWRLDLAPILISSAEWRWLEAGLVQRARLYDAILADLYGPQTLMREGHVPAELIFSDRSYLPQCQGIVPAAGPLQFYAADLARDRTGQWRVIDNHTETLAGIGSALANRVVHTHVAGDIFKRCNAVRLAGFFEALQNSLIARSGRENPRIAILTPGPHHQDYFSHAYIARYLGLLLVEGGDLRTRGSGVCLKTLEGLKDIDLLIRCVDSAFSDPLELDPSGFEGPAGLLRVCRTSPELVVNAIGSAVAQNRGLGAYLPALSERLLGEALALPEAPRTWLGDAAARQHALADLDRLVVRSAQEGTGRPGQATLGRQTSGALSPPEREELQREIELHGSRLVAEEKIGFSTAPTYVGDGFEPRPFAVRFFVARTGDRYLAMPGGLAMTVDPARAVALSAPDGHTRDVWVLTDREQAPHVSRWRPRLETARVERSQRVIQSRVADDLFWLGRYSERADWTMRVMRSSLRRIEEDSGPANGRSGVHKCLNVLLEDASHAAPAVPARIDDTAIERSIHLLVANGKLPRGLMRSVDGLYRVAHLARDRLSFEAWQVLSRFRPGDAWARAIANTHPAGLLDPLEEGLAAVAAFNGLMHENMTRNFGWTFIDMGRRLERAYNLSEVIKELFIPAASAEEEAPSLLLLLELADSFITYRSRYRLDPMLSLVLDLLLLDEANPRSLSFQLSAVSNGLERLPQPNRGVGLSEDRRLILTLQTSIRLADVVAMAEEAGRATLAELMSEQLALLPELSNTIGRHYFNLTDEAAHRVHTRSEPRR